MPKYRIKIAYEIEAPERAAAAYLAQEVVSFAANWASIDHTKFHLLEKAVNEITEDRA